MIKPTPCPLCQSGDNHFFYRDKKRVYHRCCRCALVFVLPPFYLDRAEEKAEYDLHENNVNDAGYRQFLSRVFVPLKKRLPAGATGLDFGCGPGPLLAQMFAEVNIPVALYDIFYAPDDSVLNHRYDFIAATEVVEHLHHPGEVINALYRQVNPGGYLALMTKRVSDVHAFARWHYKNDPTHVCFFAEQSFIWLARTLSAELEIISADVVLLRKRHTND